MKRVRYRFQLNSFKNESTASQKTGPKTQRSLGHWAEVYNNLGGDRVFNAAPKFFDWSDCNFQGTLSMTRPRLYLTFKKIGTLLLVCPPVGRWADVRSLKTSGKERLFVLRMRADTLNILWNNHLIIFVRKTHP